MDTKLQQGNFINTLKNMRTYSINGVSKSGYPLEEKGK